MLEGEGVTSRVAPLTSVPLTRPVACAPGNGKIRDGSRLFSGLSLTLSLVNLGLPCKNKPRPVA